MNRNLISLTLAMLPAALPAAPPATAATPLQAATPAAATAPSRPPNVVLIIADDLGYGDISAYGQGKLATPAIDAVAAAGARMTSGYAAASTCTPSRYALMTGEYPWRKRGTGILPGDAALIITPQRMTLPRLFQQAGYATAAIGKWHLGMGNGALDFNQRITPGLNELGFDYAFNMAATGDRVPTVYLENGSVVNLDPSDPIRVSYGTKVGNRPTAAGEPGQLRVRSNEGHAGTIVNGIGRIGYMSGGAAALWQDQSLSDTFNAKALDFIRNNKSKPFFLYYAAHEPHVPRDPNPRFAGRSGLGVRGDAVLQLDDQVARLMATLRDEGLDQHTLVLISSDNGPAGADGYDDGVLAAETAAAHHANGILRGGKYSDFEGGLRMPLIARWPGAIAAGQVCDALVSLTDLPAMAASLTGQALGATDAPDSIDPLPALTHCRATRDSVLFGNGSDGAPLSASAIRDGKWKLIIAPPLELAGQARLPSPRLPDPQGYPQLFDLEADVREERNLAAAHPDIVHRLRMRLEHAIRTGATRPGALAAPLR